MLLFVPCHRVVDSKRGLVGVAAEVEVKPALLHLKKRTGSLTPIHTPHQG
ncbi:MAG: hypothetical protein E7091_03375 [Bacteroidales bacterium]|nr:hypothetical protein [Bacteroidales bacterium]